MDRYKKYLVKKSDHFDPELYSFVGNDVDLMVDEIRHIGCDFKAEFVAYFLKEHCLPVEWVKANPEYVEQVRTKAVSSGNIKLLFESCYNNPVFGQQLEGYIKTKIAERYS
jgi:hypothetical protein